MAKITKEQIQKIRRKLRREEEIESGNSYRPSVQHKTSKKDQLAKEPKTIKDFEE